MLSKCATLAGMGDGYRTARERARVELTREIRDVAREQLARDGAANLSLRAVSREMGMVSSALYRYYTSRDDLLTALIIDAYEAIGAAAEQADASRPAHDLAGRWTAVGRAVRGWALEHPHEYALVYGSPVPGYRAPTATIDPAGRVIRVLGGLLRDGYEGAGRTGPVRVRRKLAPDLARVRHAVAPEVPDDVLVTGLMAWTQLFGAVSFELFGHFENVVDERAALFDEMLARWAQAFGWSAERG